MNATEPNVTTVLVTAAELDRAEFEVGGERYRHLFRARRSAVGDPLRLTDGGGRIARGRVATAGSDSALVAVDGDSLTTTPQSATTLIVPLLKPQRTAWMVEKATELEVGEVRFYSGPRAPRTLTAAGTERLLRVAAAALEQSHGAWLPQIGAPEPLAAVVDGLQPDRERWVADPQGDPAAAVRRSAVWAVGAEGGWTDEETALLQAAGFRPVRLGATTLRAETAAIAALAAGARSAGGD